VTGHGVAKRAAKRAAGRPSGRPAGRAAAGHPTGYDAVKRATDVAVAAAALTATAPLAAVAAWRIRREDRGPVLYRGTRIGRHGEPFALLKFRTMVVDAGRLGGDSTAADDPRLTRTGRWLRRWKLDELPNLVNVLRGEMSLVGPRPQVEWDVARYTADERRLLDVRPGITDWASIVFRREGDIIAGPDPDRAYDELVRPRKIGLGLAYVERRSLRIDLRILWLTGLAVIGHPRVDEMVERALARARVHV
jgi:lipopolysaccharide/colanic/teichoic acid biosynthesis glycosyltransferase